MTRVIGNSQPKNERVVGGEVRKWFEPHRPPHPDEMQCQAIADRLNRIANPMTDNEYDEMIAQRREEAAFPEFTEGDARQWWDFRETTVAAKALLAALPAMTAHWRSLEWSPETRGGTAAMDALGVALSTALPLIEWPFGQYERDRGHKEPKSWETPARLILPTIIRALMAAGAEEPGWKSPNAIAVVVLQKALFRIGMAVTCQAIAANLRRFAQWKGATTAQIAHLR